MLVFLDLFLKTNYFIPTRNVKKGRKIIQPEHRFKKIFCQLFQVQTN